MRLTEAQCYLDRCLSVSEQRDQVANMVAAIVLYWSAVEKTPTGDYLWEGVRDHICHLPPTQCQERGRDRSGQNCAQARTAGAQEDSQTHLALPTMKRGATPMFDFAEPPNDEQTASLGGAIRQAKIYAGISSLGGKAEKYLAWERLMRDVSDLFFREWSQEEALHHAKLLDSPDTTFDDMTESVPSEFPSAWLGMDQLVTESRGILRQWLMDEVGIWAIEQHRSFEIRLNQPSRDRTEKCERHCQTASWEFARPICEVLDCNEQTCEEYSISPCDVAHRLNELRKPYLRTKPKLSFISGLPPGMHL